MEKFKNLHPNQIFWGACIKNNDHLVKKYQWHNRPEVCMTVVDGAAMVQMNAHKTAKTFREYSKAKTRDNICSLLARVQQLDIVFDVYQKWSHKREVAEGHGKKDGARLSIKENTSIYRKLAKVLQLDDNKTDSLTS